MVIISTLTFNGKTLDPRRFRCEHQPDYQIPEPDYDRIHVDGRDGDIIIPSKSYKNIPRTYNISFGAAGPEDFAAAVSEISKWLESDGYGELEDSYEKEYYRLAVPVGGPKVSNILNGQMGKVTVEFSCIPKRYLKTGKLPFLVPSVNVQGDPTLFRIYNPTDYDVKPLFYIYPAVIPGTVPSEANVYIDVAENISALNGTDKTGLPYYSLTIDMSGRVLSESENVSDALIDKMAIAVDCDAEDAYSLYNPEPRTGSIKGDVDGNGVIDTADASMALAAAVGTRTLTRDQTVRADMDNDGVVTTSDARQIQRLAGGFEWKKNLNSLVKVYGDGFPVLKAKTNSVIWFEGYASKIAVVPRFWTR